MKLTAHFTKSELEQSNTAVRLGLPNVCPDNLLANMRKVANHLGSIRVHFDAPVRVLSCYRSPAVNSAVGGSSTSAHRFALAADIRVDGVEVIKVCEWCAANIPDFDQIINEFPAGGCGWCHIGFTNNRPRQECLSAVKEGGRTVYKGGIV